MKKSFWQERWQEHRIGFHLSDTNPYLSQHIEALGLTQDSHVLLPLCGKSLDLLWFSERSKKVTGVEIIPQAVDAFFQENNLTPETSEHNGFVFYRYQNIEILLGDFFALSTSVISPIDIIFDRASLVALPEKMRKAYAKKILSLMQPHTKMLLVTIDYPQEERQGPPFAVSEPEVMAHYQEHCHIEILQTVKIDDKNDNLSALSQTQETIYLLTLK